MVGATQTGCEVLSVEGLKAGPISLSVDSAGSRALALLRAYPHAYNEYELRVLNLKVGTTEFMIPTNRDIVSTDANCERLCRVVVNNRLIGWDTSQQAESFNLAAHPNEVCSVALNANGTRVMS